MSAPVPIPSYMKNLPRDHRGWPITFTSILLADGRYDFTTVDPVKWATCAKNRLCGLCGKPLLRRKWFIGGPKCMTFRVFFDLAMHEECARYALLVCPYLATPNYRGAKTRPVPDIYREEIVSADMEKPAGFGLAVTDGYTVVEFQGDVLVKAKRWIRPVEWWRDGARIEDPPPMAPVRVKTADDAFNVLRAINRSGPGAPGAKS